MIIKYNPFSETVKLNRPVRGLEDADHLIKPYFTMSLRYHENYYEDQPRGNTIYFMNLPEYSLLFYFSAGPRSHRINGFRIQAGERQKAWIYMLPMIQSLRSYAFGTDGETGAYDASFLDNTADLEDAMLDELVPFHFILSSLPAECFPVCPQMRLFNGHHLQQVSKSYHLVSRGQVRQTTMPMEDYDVLSEIFWIPPTKMSKKWYLEYYTGIMNKEGRNKGKYRVIRQATELPGADGCCSYDALADALVPLIRENL